MIEQQRGSSSWPLHMIPGVSAWLTSSLQGSGGGLLIRSLRTAELTITNSSLGCVQAQGGGLQEGVVQVGSADEFRHALGAVVQASQPSTLQLEKPVSLAGALPAWPQPSGFQLPSSALRLTIWGSGEAGPATWCRSAALDLRMAGRLLQVPQGVLLRMHGVCMVGLCSRVVQVSVGSSAVQVPLSAPVWALSSAQTSAGLAISARPLLTNVVMAVTPAELALISYWSLLWPPGRTVAPASYTRPALLSLLLGSLGSPPEVTQLTPSSITLASLSTPTLRGSNITLMTPTALQPLLPDGPDFALLPTTNCDTGAALPSELWLQDRSLAPMWVVEGSNAGGGGGSALLDALQRATALARQQAGSAAAGGALLPAVVLASDMVAPDALESFGIEVNADVLLAGEGWWVVAVGVGFVVHSIIVLRMVQVRAL